MTDDRPASDSAPDQASLGLLQGLATTRAIRRYTDEPVAEEDLATIVWHATREPSGSNRQPFRFLILRDGPLATQAKALLGKSFRALWAEKRRRDGYDAAAAPQPTPRRPAWRPRCSTSSTTSRPRLAALRATTGRCVGDRSRS